MERTSNKKRSLLELGLSKVPDAYVRAAFEQVQYAINRLMSQGLETIGYLKARSFEGETAVFSKLVRAGVFQCSEDAKQKFTVQVEQSGLGAGAATSYTYPKPILSVMGYTQVSGGTNWRLMIASTSSSACYFNITGSGNNWVEVVNGDASNANDYRLVVILDGR